MSYLYPFRPTILTRLPSGINRFAIKIAFTDSSETNNMRVTYSGGIVESVGAAVWSGVEAMKYYTIQPGEIFYFYLFYSPEDKNKSASYVSTAEKGISFDIQQA